MKTKKNTTQKPAKKRPLFRMSRADVTGNLWVIADTPAEAVRIACKLWSLNGLAVPLHTEAKHLGTVDYIPALLRPHYEITPPANK